MQQRGTALDRAFSYGVPDGLALRTGDVVRVPLGPREMLGFVLTEPRLEPAPPARLRPVAGRAGETPAFDAAGLALAHWIAERYCCTLAEALGALVYAPAMPRTVDRFEPGPAFAAAAVPSVPPRLVRLIREDLRDGFALEALLRHPDARRAGDRRALLAALATLVRAGVLVRRRGFAGGRVAERTERLLEATGTEVRGPRVRALVAAVVASGSLRRADALLAGFTQSLIARAIREGALRERLDRKAGARGPLAIAPPAFTATPEQQTATAALIAGTQSGHYYEALVQGVTGSGKTFVYLQTIARTIAGGGRAIVLVPEIALTPQTSRRFERVFGDRVAVLHSGLSDRERYDAWHAAARGEIDVVVGARSAVFAPLPQLRLIVIDEAHERTYKQEGVPRYDTLAVARERMRALAGALVMGSATPPLEAYAAALRGEIAHLRLHARATNAALPAVRIVDLAREHERGNTRVFASALVDGIGLRLERAEKTVLFVNRRGSAAFLLCRTCGAVPNCDRCTTTLAVHRHDALLRCHLCDAQRPIPQRCPACGAETIREFGVGTERVAAEVRALFPQARVVRMDSDTTTRVGDHARLLDAFEASGDVLVGTQMVAKGLDFEAVTLVGVVAADVGLHVPDFRAAERSFDLLTQVAGRSGRARPGEAIVQTYAPEHPAIVFAARHDFDGFAVRELAERAATGFPPSADLAYFVVAGRTETEVAAAAERYAVALRAQPGFDVLGPAPAPIARVNEEWRYRVAVRTRRGAALRAFVRGRLQPLAGEDSATRLAVNIDP